MESIINNYDETLILVSIIVGLLLLVLLQLVFKYKKELTQTRKLLGEKEEKIAWFRQIDAENERTKVALSHKVELETQDLQYTIEKLEKDTREGTKNQVIAKLEAQQNKREKLLNRTGFSRTKA